MPALERPGREVLLQTPPRQALLAAETDVLVVGGGPAGLGAALGAAQAGARVVIVEKYGFFGGHATVCLVGPFMTFYTNEEGGPRGGDALFPADHTAGRPVVGGILRDLVERLVKAGGAMEPSAENGFTLPFDPEKLKLVYEGMLDDANVPYLFHSVAFDVHRDDKRIREVIFATKSGPVAVRAGVAIDCTGDGDIAALAGAPFEIGRAGDGMVQPASLIFRMAGFDKKEFFGYANGHPGQWEANHGLWDLIDEAARNGDLDLKREDILFFGSVREGEITVNSTRVRVLGTDVWDLTGAEREGRRQMEQIAAFLKKYVPGFAKSYVAQSGTAIAVRETRRITGEYAMTADDVLQARSFDDVIARGTYPIDIHSPEGKGTVLKRLPPGKAYDIPLRCLIPLGPENILTAGRCISGSHEAFASYRIMPTSIATGQAAGACAALAARSGRIPREVPAREVQEELLRQGAILHD